VTILSRDKDLAQALQPGDFLWDYPTGRKLGYHKVPEAYGVAAEQIADYLALIGDAVDNIPGVRGIGPKTAAALLRKFSDLDGIYADTAGAARINVRGAPGLPARLDEQRDAAFLARSLTRLRCDVPVPEEPDPVARTAPDLDALDAIYDAAGFGEGLRRQARRIAEAWEAAAAA
jgi:DNA polymerase-1